MLFVPFFSSKGLACLLCASANERQILPQVSFIDFPVFIGVGHRRRHGKLKASLSGQAIQRKHGEAYKMSWEVGQSSHF